MGSHDERPTLDEVLKQGRAVRPTPEQTAQTCCVCGRKCQGAERFGGMDFDGDNEAFGIFDTPPWVCAPCRAWGRGMWITLRPMY